MNTGAEQPLTFGDTVRVRSTEEAQAAGLAGLVGKVVGETIPSMSGEQVVLPPQIDYAIGVSFDEFERTLFLPHDVLEFIDHQRAGDNSLHAPLEFIDHGPGQVFGIKTKRGRTAWVRRENGEWQEVEELAEPFVPTGVPTEPEPASLLRRLLTLAKRRP